MAGAKSKLIEELEDARRLRRFAFLKQLRLDANLSAAAKMVVWSLADDSYNVESERCNPGFTTIATNIGRARSSFAVSLNEAKDAGWITVESIGGGGKRNTNGYTLGMGQGRQHRESAKARSSVETSI
jgi:hypothetical protein